MHAPGNNFEKEFESQFSNSSFHEPNTILGMKFEKENDKIMLSLPNHIQHGLEELFKRININYRSAIGLLNHIAQLTCPDISFAVYGLAHYSVKPGITHWHKVKKVWQYLKGTYNLKLTLEVRKPYEQRCVTHSSTEAKLNPLVDTFHEGIWLKALLAEIWNIQLNKANHLIDDEHLNEILMNK
ncbi:hypothetical protein VP01_1042g6 [Puccinia sorghi]|uniref:Reverse transcriptase Ty1/copia-type domain-containing protein n=1 Tax=Puccinia sorghi TaxID=27349 RepID=A0A0L6VUE0_9BASI|nr:hypothetical protein VP01_1042g6 [Puccinia sorghi]